MTFNPARLGDILRARREELGLGLKEVAAKVDVHLSMIGNVETGKASPSYETLRRWLRAIDLPVEWADEWQDWGYERDLEKLLDSIDPPLSPDRRAAQKVFLQDALKARRA